MDEVVGDITMEDVVIFTGYLKVIMNIAASHTLPITTLPITGAPTHRREPTLPLKPSLSRNGVQSMGIPPTDMLQCPWLPTIIIQTTLPSHILLRNIHSSRHTAAISSTRTKVHLLPPTKPSGVVMGRRLRVTMGMVDHEVVTVIEVVRNPR